MTKIIYNDFSNSIIFIRYEKKKKTKLTKNSLYFLLNVNHAQYQTHQLIYIKCKIL